MLDHFLHVILGIIIGFIFCTIIDIPISYFRNRRFKKQIEKQTKDFLEKYGDYRFYCPLRTSVTLSPPENKE